MIVRMIAVRRDTCCSGSFVNERNEGKCIEDKGLYWYCFHEETVCYGKCGTDAKASTKVTVDFDIDIEGAFVEEA